MYTLTQITLASATLWSMAAGLPSQKCEFLSVAQVPNTKFVPNGPVVYAKAFQKFNKPMPHDLAVASGNDGSVTATPGDAYDAEYLCPVSIDGQTLALQFDSGSADLRVSYDLN
jgi:aspergillopepsin I